jgi:hypothetical protein
MAENLQSPGQLPTSSQPTPNPPANNFPPAQQKQPPQPQPQAQKAVRQSMIWEVKPGSLFVGRYLFWKHDPTPLVLVSSLYRDGRIAGVNLHNLTLDDMRKVVAQYCNKATFNYHTAIKGRTEIVKGFRTYKSKNAWKNNAVRLIDCQMLLGEMGVVQRARMMSPSEVEKIRQQVRQQLQQKINPRASDMTRYSQKSNSSVPGIAGRPASVPGISVGMDANQHMSDRN